MKIVHVASEMFPYVKTGGLADAVGALAGILADRGHEVSVFLPGYRAVLEHKDAAGAERRLPLKIEMGDMFITGEVRVFSPKKNLTVYLICREEYFDRRGLYGTGEIDAIAARNDPANQMLVLFAHDGTLRVADFEPGDAVQRR